MAVTMAVTKPYKSIGFGAMAATKPYKSIGFGAMAVTKPYKFIGMRDMRKHIMFSHTRHARSSQPFGARNLAPAPGLVKLKSQGVNAVGGNRLV